MPSRPQPRYALRAGATALTAGLLALGTASPGQAADGDAPLEFSFVGGSDAVEVQPFYIDSDDKITVEGRNTGAQELKNVEVTIDASALKGQVRWDLPYDCEKKQQEIAVCRTGKSVKPGASFGTTWAWAALTGAEPGRTGEVRISAEAGGVAVGETTMKATVADIGLLVANENAYAVPKPGETVEPVTAIRNFSTRPVQDVYVSLYLSQGLSFVEEFSNCVYGSVSEYRSEDTVMKCRVKGPVEPGATYGLDMSALKVGATAGYEKWTGGVDERDTAEDPVSPHHGTGREMKLVKRAADPGMLQKGVYGTARVASSADLEAVGATVDGKAGQVVKAELGVRNNGPATIENWGSEPGDSPSSEVFVTIPPGTTAVKAPADCRPTEFPVPEGADSREYFCHQDLGDYYFNAGQLAPFVFDLRIDKPAALAPGSIKLTHQGDSKPKNNTAPIYVTVDGKLGDGTTPSTGGTGGTGSTSGGSTATPGTGDATATPGTGGSAASASGGTGSGPMADTGAGALPWYAAAAATALAAGGVLFTVARRRRAGRA
ncbi:hypothetical protein OKJ48_22970 [Streptomyces kunmingensis]|uniref:Peptidase n=1 Tax=Streptomyces kunmingensis TaxID=68225 RepID=A0ABU6CEP1_9ACTN|nr:hypothetical protein [Streptomyces kunmingensis]MEB3963087.1 hypothetical protein [Streptomyces kunmingensis]